MDRVSAKKRLKNKETEERCGVSGNSKNMKR